MGLELHIGEFSHDLSLAKNFMRGWNLQMGTCSMPLH